MVRQRPTRRSLLGTLGTLGIGSAAGCLDLSSDGADLETFSYPPGFTTDGVDLDTAMGPGSAMAARDSLTLDYHRETHLAEEEIESDLHQEIDAAANRFVRTEEQFNAHRLELTLSDAYFDGDELIRRRRVEPRSIEYSYGAEEHTLTRRRAYRLGEFHRLFSSVDLTADAIEERNGTEVVVYQASKADIGEESAIREGDPSLTKGSLELAVDAEGLLRTVDVKLGLGDGDQTNATLSGRWTFSGFDETAVDRPDWLEEVEGLERPVVELTIEETVGESIHVDIESMDRTDEVAIVIQAHGVVEDGTEPFSVEIPAETYLTEDDAVRTILVFAENPLRGPVLVETFFPTPPE